MFDVVCCCVVDELGFCLSVVCFVFFDYWYCVVDVSGIVENEICFVYIVVVDDELFVDFDEVVEWVWVEIEVFIEVVVLVLFVFSFWFVEQLFQLYWFGEV